jgi:C4-type Zn-finger protein
MKIKAILNKNMSKKIICPICGSKNLKMISILEYSHLKKVTRLDLTLLCQDDHIWNIKEYIKKPRLYKPRNR